MLVSAKEMLDKAKAGHYAVGHFNINNLEWAKAVLLTAQELKSPVILVPVALHLDHGTYEGCYKCIKAGFTSIMFDGSHYSIEENIEKTKELVAVAHRLGLSIEAEVGSIGGEEDGVIGGSRLEKYIGHWKMAVVYFAAGIGGGLLSYIMMLLSGNYAVSGGASGAVFGVIGGLLWVVIYHRGKLEGMTTKGILIMIGFTGRKS